MKTMFVVFFCELVWFRLVSGEREKNRLIVVCPVGASDDMNNEVSGTAGVHAER